MSSAIDREEILSTTSGSSSYWRKDGDVSIKLSPLKILSKQEAIRVIILPKFSPLQLFPNYLLELYFYRYKNRYKISSSSSNCVYAFSTVALKENGKFCARFCDCAGIVFFRGEE